MAEVWSRKTSRLDCEYLSSRCECGNGQIVRQVPWTDDLNAVIKHKNTHGSGNEVITMNQGVSNQLFQHNSWNFQFSGRINTLPMLLAS
jgi:hypothetical protein